MKTETLTPVKQLPIRKFSDPTIFFLLSFFGSFRTPFNMILQSNPSFPPPIPPQAAPEPHASTELTRQRGWWMSMMKDLNFEDGCWHPCRIDGKLVSYLDRKDFVYHMLDASTHFGWKILRTLWSLNLQTEHQRSASQNSTGKPRGQDRLCSNLSLHWAWPDGWIQGFVLQFCLCFFPTSHSLFLLTRVIRVNLRGNSHAISPSIQVYKNMFFWYI